MWTAHPDDASPETVEVLDGLVVRRLPMPLPATNWPAIRRTAVTGTRTLFSLRNAVAAFRPDVLHVQCFGPNGAYATALARLTGLPLVITLQGETLMDDTDIFDSLPGPCGPRSGRPSQAPPPSPAVRPSPWPTPRSASDWSPAGDR